MFLVVLARMQLQHPPGLSIIFGSRSYRNERLTNLNGMISKPKVSDCSAISGLLFLDETPPNSLKEPSQERKSSPKSEFSGRISCGHPRGYPGERPGAKTSVRPSKSWKKQAFRCGHP